MIRKLNLPKVCPGILLGILMLLATQVWAPACGMHSDGTYGNCHYAQMVVLGVGILMLCTVLTLIFNKESKGIAVILILEAVLLLLVPKVIIPLCKMSSMKCLKSFYPTVILFGVLFILYGLVIFGLSFLKPKKRRD